MIEKRRIWTDEVLADYIRDELGFPGARQGAMVEKEAVDIATGEVSRERWYLLTSLSSRRCGPKELQNSLHHVKDRSWDEDVHTLRRPGLGEVYATLVNTAERSGSSPLPPTITPTSLSHDNGRRPTIEASR